MGISRIYIALVLLLVLASCGGTEPAGKFNPSDDYESRSGEFIYQQQCERCHGPDGKSGTGGAKDLSKSKMDSLEIVEILEKGKNAMPRQMHNIETEEELNNLIDHIKSLRK